MKYTKSYTNKWMHHYTNFWHEEQIRYGFKIIVIDKEDAPKVVRERVKEINNRRYEKHAQCYYVRGYSLEAFIRGWRRKEEMENCPIYKFIKILDEERRIEKKTKNMALPL